MDLFFSQLQSASQICTASEVAEDKKMKFADAVSILFLQLASDVFTDLCSQLQLKMKFADDTRD